VWPQLYGYDRAGSVEWIQDGNNHRTNVSYVDSFSDGINRGTLAYPTSVTNADGFSTTLQYRHDIGTTTRVQDPKGAYQTMTYDGAGRILQVTNGINSYYTRWSYPNTMLGVYTYLPSQYGGGEVFAGQFLDGAGRVRRTSVDHPNSSGGYSGRQIDYDVMGRVVRQSNPTESDGMWNAAGDDYLAGGWRWTTQEYDWKDRPTRTINPDNTTREVKYTGCGCAGGETQMWRDESGRWRRLIKDVLGRLKQVDELGRDESLYATTTYTYNGRDQITQINQAGQTPRTFEYDGHGRLWRRTTPEQGLTQYTYYPDDTMQSVTDARGAVATCDYNGRRLIKSVNYTVPANVAPTNNVTFGYDEAGNRSSMTEKDRDNNVVGSTTYNYDTLSRMKWEERTFGGLSGAYRISYGYNTAGSLTSVTNPWNVEVGYIHDRVGRLRGVSGANYAGVSFYAHNMDYRAFGAVKFMNYGNNPRTFSASYDTRMRMTEWKVPDVMWWQFAYDKFGEQTGRVTYAKNMYDATLNRSYEYDQWRRLYASHTGAEADVHVGLRAYQNPPIQQHEYGPYAQLRFYDVWGNQVQRIGWGGANPSLTASYTNNRKDGHQYDFAGNLTGDGGQEFTYDATGQQAWATAGNTSQEYDGNALRTRRVENGQTTYYLRSTVLGGQVVAEIDQWGGRTRGYVYAGTQLLALQQYGGVEWVHQDMVTKSQRLTNIYGTVISLVDLDPWGGETAASVSQSRQPQRFTTYKRDANQSDEAMARRYNRWWGRFDQPDPYDGSYDLTDPQSLNRYSYVQNDPVNYIDPTGLDGVLDEGIGAARDALKSGACKALFKGVDAEKLLDQYANPANNLLRVGPTTLGGSAMPEETAAITNSRSGIITINSNGFYFSGQITSFSGDRTSVTEIRAFGLYGLSPSEMRGAIILHELLHTQKLIPSDAGDINQSQINSEKVRLFCFVLPNLPVSTTGNIITELRGGRGSSGGRGGGGGGGSRSGGTGDLSWLYWLYEGLPRAPERSRVH
jgi:RHS repeat-associated protein